MEIGRETGETGEREIERKGGRGKREVSKRDRKRRDTGERNTGKYREKIDRKTKERETERGERAGKRYNKITTNTTKLRT